MADKWYYGRDGQQDGPVTLSQLKSMVTTGQVVGTDLVWCEGWDEWMPVSGTSELKTSKGPPPPPMSPQNECRQCREPILPAWKACPACGVLVSPEEPTQPHLKTGANSVVNANIRQVPTVGAPVTRHAASPLVQTGSDSVVKATIDASNNLHQHGQFVKNQTVVHDQSNTVIHESSIGSLIRMMTSGFSNERANEIESQIASLPDDPAELFPVLAQTLRHLLREAKRAFKQEKRLFAGASAPGNFAEALKDAKAQVTGLSKENRKQLDLCKQILDKLHDVGHASNDSHLISDIDRLDDCLIETESLLKKRFTLRQSKMFVMLGLFGVPLFLVIGVMMLSAGQGFGLLLALLYGCMAGVGYWFFTTTLTNLEQGIADAEKVTSELADRR